MSSACAAHLADSIGCIMSGEINFLSLTKAQLALRSLAVCLFFPLADAGAGIDALRHLFFSRRMPTINSAAQLLQVALVPLAHARPRATAFSRGELQDLSGGGGGTFSSLRTLADSIHSECV